MSIHPTAIVDETSEVGENVTIGPYSIVRKNAVIENGVEIHAHAVIGEGVILRQNCQVFHGAVVGEVPQDLKFEGEETVTEIGENTVIREYATIHRGTKDRMKTVIGHDCLIMAYVHVAHDCLIGNNVILANAVNLAGHVTIENNATLGGLVPVHQFVRIGQYCFIGGGYRVSKDVPPYILASNEPLSYCGLNSVGLRRKGFSQESRELMKKAYRLIFRSELNRSQALKEIKTEFPQTQEIRNIIEFIEKSKRGLIH